MLGQHRSTQRKPPQPDPRLGEALRGEGPGILRWMIEGALHGSALTLRRRRWCGLRRRNSSPIKTFLPLGLPSV
jgi:hypothetical protein